MRGCHGSFTVVAQLFPVWSSPCDEAMLVVSAKSLGGVVISTLVWVAESEVKLTSGSGEGGGSVVWILGERRPTAPSAMGWDRGPNRDARSSFENKSRRATLERFPAKSLVFDRFLGKSTPPGSLPALPLRGCGLSCLSQLSFLEVVKRNLLRSLMQLERG